MSQDWKNYIRTVSDFPHEGVSFKDLAPVFSNPQYFRKLVEDFLTLFHQLDFDCFAGVESRGFILASAMAARTGKGLVLLRKAGKLPPPVFQESYSLEYGKATLEIQPGRGKVVLVDDVLATGGTIQAALKLCEKAGYDVLDVGFVMNLSFLNQFKFRGKAPSSLIVL